MGYDFLASFRRSSPTSDEVRLAEQHRLMARLATEQLRNDVHGWAVRHFAELTPEAMRDLYETIGLRRKA